MASLAPEHAEILQNAADRFLAEADYGLVQIDKVMETIFGGFFVRQNSEAA